MEPKGSTEYECPRCREYGGASVVWETRHYCTSCVQVAKAKAALKKLLDCYCDYCGAKMPKKMRSYCSIECWANSTLVGQLIEGSDHPDLDLKDPDMVATHRAVRRMLGSQVEVAKSRQKAVLREMFDHVRVYRRGVTALNKWVDPPVRIEMYPEGGEEE